MCDVLVLAERHLSERIRTLPGIIQLSASCVNPHLLLLPDPVDFTKMHQIRPGLQDFRSELWDIWSELWDIQFSQVSNIIKTLLIVVLFFFLCFASEETFYLLYNLGYEVNWDGVYYKFSVIMVFLNCTVNPFIYLFNYKDFQKA